MLRSNRQHTGHERRLNAFLDDAVTTIRPLFGGRLTYSSGTWEQVDWRRFDVMGIDLYRDAGNEATFIDEVREPASPRQARRDHRVRLLCVSRGADDIAVAWAST